MKTDHSRREFLSKTSKIGLVCGVIACCPKMLGLGQILPDGVVPDPKSLNYCGYSCPSDCAMKKATTENNIELKKKAYDDWRIEKKYGIVFDPDKIFCYGCKTDAPKLGIVVEKCTVRSCAIEKGFDCCIECDELAYCDKEIWKTFPDFHKAMIELRKKYQEAKS